MSDLAKWKVKGPVETLRSETITWDFTKKEWQPARYFTITSFRPDGAVSTNDTHKADGSIWRSRSLYDNAGRMTESDSWRNDEPADQTLFFYDDAGRPIRTTHVGHDGSQTDLETYSYDASGRKTEVRFLFPPPEIPDKSGKKTLYATTGYAIEGTDSSYSAPGATTMTTIYDEKDLPSEVVFHDANHNQVGRVVFTRDSTGRLLKEEQHFGEPSPFQDLIDKAPPEQREGVAAVLKQAFGGSFSSVSYVYDSQGRVIERTLNMGNLGGFRTTYQYDDHDNPVEETTEDRSRQAEIDDHGNVRYSADSVDVQHTRMEYRYDAHGNWTERKVSGRPESNPDFQISNIERRTITYYSS